jgi:hypothetical protein
MTTRSAPREATPQDTIYRLRLSRGLCATLSFAQKVRLKQFNAAMAAIAGKPASHLPVMPVRNMTRKALGPVNAGFRYGVPAENHGFTMATNSFDVLLNGIIGETGVKPARTGVSLCLN